LKVALVRQQIAELGARSTSSLDEERQAPGPERRPGLAGGTRGGSGAPRRRGCRRRRNVERYRSHDLPVCPGACGWSG
jgi:hypothetical protein